MCMFAHTHSHTHHPLKRPCICLIPLTEAGPAILCVTARVQPARMLTATMFGHLVTNITCEADSLKSRLRFFTLWSQRGSIWSYTSKSTLPGSWDNVTPSYLINKWTKTLGKSCWSAEFLISKFFELFWTFSGKEKGCINMSAWEAKLNSHPCRVFLFTHHSSGSRFLRWRAISNVHYKQLYLDIVMRCKAITEQSQATISSFRNISCYTEQEQSSGVRTERLRVHGWRGLQQISCYCCFSITISQTG